MRVPSLKSALSAGLLLAAASTHAFDVSVANASSSNGSWQGNNTWVPTGANSVVSQAEVLARLASGPVTVTATGSDTLTVNAPLAWGANTLSLQAGGSIRIHTGMALKGSAGLALEWGLAGQDADSDWGYFLGEGVKIDLAETTGFQTRRGSNGVLENYAIVTRLGTDYNGVPDPHGLQWMGVRAALGADIDASGTAFWNNGKQFVPGYRRRFAGLGHTIDGLHMRAFEAHVPAPADRSDRGGLFTSVDYVQDLRLTNLSVDVQGGNLVGGVTGVLNGRMQNVHSTGQVRVTPMGNIVAPRSIGGLVGHSWGRILDSSSAATVAAHDGNEIGGLVGTMQALNGYTASIERSRNTGEVTGATYVGGLAGRVSAADFLPGTQSRIVDSHNTGTVDSNTFFNHIGGLAGSTERVDVVDSSSVATVGPANSRGRNVGGLVGEARGTVVWGSHSGGLVRGKDNLGGLVGSMVPLHKRYGEYVGSVERSFSAARVAHSHATEEATSIGGLVGSARGVRISQSFSTGPVSVREGYGVGGLVGHLWPYWTGEGPGQECHGTGAAQERGVRVDNSYSVSPVTALSGRQVGGLIGWMVSSTDGADLCPARVSNALAGGRSVNGGAASDVGGLIGGYQPVGSHTAQYATTHSAWDIEYTGIGADNGQGGVPEWDNLRGNLIFNWLPWDGDYVWLRSPSPSSVARTWNLFPGLREIRLMRPVDVRMSAETTYTGSASAWDGITPALTYSIGGTAIPTPGLEPVINASGLTVGAANPGWQAGTYEQPVSGLLSNQFRFTYSAGLTVKKAPITVRALPVNKTYDDTVFSGGNVEITGFVGGETASVLRGTLTFSGSSQGAHHAGSYTITPGGLSADNYEITYVSAPLTIAPAPLVLQPTADLKAYDGTPYSNRLPSIVSGALRGDDVLTNLGQVFDSANVGTRQIGIDPDFVVQDGNGGRNYQVSLSATPVFGTIAPVSLAVKANNASKPFDGAPYNGGNGVQYYGFINGEGPGVLAGTLAYGGSSQGATAVGNYAISPSGLYSAAGNYVMQFISGTLNISNRALIVRANDVARTYDGTAHSGGDGVTYTGFQDGDTAASLGGTLAFGGDSQGARNAGSYAIEPSGLTSAKYDITFIPGTLTVQRAPLIIKADDKSRSYNRGPFTEFTAAYTGFVNGEGPQDLQGSLTYRLRTCASCWLDTPPLAGNYNIVPGGLTSANYAITYATGDLAIARLPLTITVLGVARTYDGRPLADPGPSGLYIDGLLPGDDMDQQTAQVNPSQPLYVYYNPAQLAQTAAGSTPLQARYRKGGAVINNSSGTLGYDITYVDGIHTVNPTPLTIAANDDTRPEGSPAYSGGNGVQYAGFVNNETTDVLTGTLVYGGTSQGATAKGRYTIVPSGQTAPNYAITYVPGQLTVGNPGGNAIDISPTAGGSVACTPNPVDDGQNATCTASAQMGYRFANWGGDCSGTTPATSTTCQLTNVRSAKTVGAQFAPITTHSGTTVPASGAGGQGTARFTGGGPACRFDPAATAFAAAPAVLPPGQTLPQGVFGFKLMGCNATPVTMQVTWPQPITAYTKYGKASNGAQAASYFAPPGLALEPNGHTATFTLTDGQPGDDDGLENGEITDPTGPTAPAGGQGPGPHAIAIAPSAGGSVACTPNPVNNGQNATCTATAASGWRLDGWGGDCAATSAESSTCQLANVQAPKAVSARFVATGPAQPTPIPTLSQWSVWLLSGLLGLAALRRRA